MDDTGVGPWTIWGPMLTSRLFWTVVGVVVAVVLVVVLVRAAVKETLRGIRAIVLVAAISAVVTGSVAMYAGLWDRVLEWLSSLGR